MSKEPRFTIPPLKELRQDPDDPDVDPEPYPIIPITVYCPLCGNPMVMQCKVQVETDYDEVNGVYTAARVMGDEPHDCPNIIHRIVS